MRIYPPTTPAMRQEWDGERCEQMIENPLGSGLRLERLRALWEDIEERDQRIADPESQLAEHTRERDEARAGAARMREALPDPHKLLLLSQWFTMLDSALLADLDMQRDDEVQRDLALWAERIDAALATDAGRETLEELQRLRADAIFQKERWENDLLMWTERERKLVEELEQLRQKVHDLEMVCKYNHDIECQFCDELVSLGVATKCEQHGQNCAAHVFAETLEGIKRLRDKSAKYDKLIADSGRTNWICEECGEVRTGRRCWGCRERELVEALRPFATTATRLIADYDARHKKGE